MSAHREMLEGEAYWGRIRNIKKRLYLLEAVLIAVLSALLIILSNRFQTNPFFMPFDILISFVLAMLFVIEVEGFVFRIMQIRIAKSDSTKHLMTINSIRKAVVIILVAALFAAILSVPAIVGGLQDSLAVRGEVRPNVPQQFLPSDPMGLSRIESVTVHCDSATTVYIVSKYNFDMYKGDWASLQASALNNDGYVNPDLRIPMPNITYATMYLVVDPTLSYYGNQTVATFTLEMRLSDTLTSFVPLMAIVFLISNGAWIAYLLPLSRKYAAGSIYK